MCGRFAIHGEVQLSGGFQVNLGALRDAAAGINDTLEELRTTQVDALSRTEADYGHDDLAAAVAGFCDRWQVGVQNLAKDAHEVAGRLSRSAEDYSRLDQSVQERMGGILPGSGGQDPGAV